MTPHGYDTVLFCSFQQLPRQVPLKGFLNWLGYLQGYSTSPLILLPELQRHNILSVVCDSRCGCPRKPSKTTVVNLGSVFVVHHTLLHWKPVEQNWVSDHTGLLSADVLWIPWAQPFYSRSQPTPCWEWLLWLRRHRPNHSWSQVPGKSQHQRSKDWWWSFWAPSIWRFEGTQCLRQLQHYIKGL